MRITSKGQVTIPQLGLLPNTAVEFAVERGAAVLRPKQGPPTRAERIVAHLKTHGGATMRMSSRALLALLRDEPDELDPR